MSRPQRPIDRLIERAREAGVFEDLPGTGKPLPNLDEVSDPAWWAKQLMRREGLSLLPTQLEVRRRVERALETLVELADENAVRARVADLNAEVARTNARIVTGPPSDLGRLDEEEIVARWRERRAARTAEPAAPAPERDSRSETRRLALQLLGATLVTLTLATTLWLLLQG
ncbi:MAG: DUF1992 domain-containing protein [Myxococcota bacterium]|nr:DUF1992 domain-containing protein [Myxococcota bacterium]